MRVIEHCRDRFSVRTGKETYHWCVGNDDSHAELHGIPVYAEPVTAVFKAHDSAHRMQRTENIRDNNVKSMISIPNLGEKKCTTVTVDVFVGALLCCQGTSCHGC